MSINLSTARATCPHCGHTSSQISTTREHAVETVTHAMEQHITEKHPAAAVSYLEKGTQP